MSSLIIKIIAAISMAVDHTGVLFFHNNIIFRYFGRIYFPLLAFLLVEGFMKRKDDKKSLIKYFLLILITAIVSEQLYDKLFFNSLMYFGSQSVIFELLLGLICIWLYDKYSSFLLAPLSMLIILYLAFIGEFMNLNYGALGILLIFSYYLIRKADFSKKKNFLFYLIVDMSYIALFFFLSGGNVLQVGVLLSLIPIAFYKDKKDKISKFNEYFFFVFYPLHLLIMLIIKM